MKDKRNEFEYLFALMRIKNALREWETITLDALYRSEKDNNEDALEANSCALHILTDLLQSFDDITRGLLVNR